MAILAMLFNKSKWLPEPRLQYKVTATNASADGAWLFSYDKSRNGMYSTGTEILPKETKFITDGRVNSYLDLIYETQAQFIKITECPEHPNAVNMWVYLKDVEKIGG